MKFIFSLPNQLTYLRILLTPVFLVLLFSSDAVLRQWALVTYIVAALTDWYDGWLARRWGYVTRWGAFADPFADKVLTSAALFAFFALDLVPGWTVWAIVLRDALITFLRSYCEFKGRTFDTSRMAKTKTFAQMVAVFYILTFYVGQDVQWLSGAAPTFRVLLHPTLLGLLMTLIAGITVLSGVLYLIGNWSTVEDMFHISKPPSQIAAPSGTPPPALPVRLFSSVLFTGYIPFASGTFGSAVAAGCYLLPGFERAIIIIPVILLAYGFGIAASIRMENYYGHDPAEVTVDEAVGMWVSLLFLPKSIPILVTAFFLFRAMDIIKPFPARRIDRMRGGFGIMTDDVVAGIYANLVLQALLLLTSVRSFLL